jgi:hypothetical protein
MGRANARQLGAHCGHALWCRRPCTQGFPRSPIPSLAALGRAELRPDELPPWLKCHEEPLFVLLVVLNDEPHSPEMEHYHEQLNLSRWFDRGGVVHSFVLRPALIVLQKRKPR